MSFLRENWLYILAIALFVGMHLFGAGCSFGHFRRRRTTRHDHELTPVGDSASAPPRAKQAPDNAGIHRWI